MPKKTQTPSPVAAVSPRELPALRKRPNQSRSRALVDAVAEACMRILDEGGEEALTVARIAEVSGAAVGSIYQYFPNKDAILLAVMEWVAERLLGRVDKAIEAAPSPLAALEAAVDVLDRKYRGMAASGS